MCIQIILDYYQSNYVAVRAHPLNRGSGDAKNGNPVTLKTTITVKNFFHMEVELNL